MSHKPTIGREDLLSCIGASNLDKLIAAPIEHDEPDREAALARRLAWACAMGVDELSMYIDLTAFPELTGLYHGYAVAFTLIHLERTTKGGGSQKSRDDYDLFHKNLAMAHKGERLPGERDQRSVVTAIVITDESRWSSGKMYGFE